MGLAGFRGIGLYEIGEPGDKRAWGDILYFLLTAKTSVLRSLRIISSSVSRLETRALLAGSAMGEARTEEMVKKKRKKLIRLEKEVFIFAESCV
jgi:hypothetical protein